MNAPTARMTERRTVVDEIFEFLHEEITTMRLRPGDKISEAEIAKRFEVSRQPVRDAFNRLANLDLLHIRPQRATEVKRFSSREIEKSRFVRASIEKEVLRLAAAACTSEHALQLEQCLERQAAAISECDMAGFGSLDYEFHRILCDIASVEFAFDVILTEKSKVDRLCVLGLSKEDRMPELLEDHRAIARAVVTHDAERAVALGALHLSRLDDTIKRIASSNADYFADESLH